MTIWSAVPTQRELEELQLGSAVPVARVLRTVYVSDGVAVEVQDTVAAADKHRLRYQGHDAMSRLRLAACWSLTGRYGRFGRQAANGLRVWQQLAGGDVGC